MDILCGTEVINFAIRKIDFETALYVIISMKISWMRLLPVQLHGNKDGSGYHLPPAADWAPGDFEVAAYLWCKIGES